MTRTQAINLPPWKLPVWFTKIDDHLQKVTENLKSLASEDEQTDHGPPKIYGLVCCIISKKIEDRKMKEESKNEECFVKYP